MGRDPMTPSMKPGLYSIIQYWHNRSRAEGVNVGVVVALAGSGEVRVEMAPDNRAVRRVVGRVDEVHLTAAKRAFKHRLENELHASVEALDTCASAEAGSLVLTPARRVVVESLEATACRLFAELVTGATDP